MTATRSSEPGTPESAAGTAAGWHLAWVLWVGLGAALLLIRLGGAPRPVLLALGCGAAAGLVGWLLRPSNGHGVWVMAIWALAAAIAMASTGGVTSPLMAWAICPLLAAAVLGGLWRDGATLSFAVLTGVAFIQAAGKAGPAPTGPTAFWLAVVGLATTLAGAATAAMILAENRVRVAEPAAPAEAPAPEPAPVEPAGPSVADLEARVAEAEAGRTAAEADARAKMRFLANMSHELRTPLNAIMGFSDIMRAKMFGDLQPKYAEYAELIHESGGHLLDLISDVLDMSKIEADKYVLQREVFDAREPVNAALRILRVQADDAGVGLRGMLPSEELPVDADARAIKQIVLNLVANALKFTPAGGAVHVAVDAVDGELQLMVVDTGVGIAPEDLARIGQPYEQVGDFKTRPGGTGLGLSLVRAFARLHGGEMIIESRLGEGTAVTVRLPVLTGAAAEPRPAQQTEPA